MADRQGNVMEGSCTCGAVRYRLKAQPLFVHCCHCTWCQRESGSAFAVNAFIEASQVELLKGKLTQTTLPSASGNGQVFWRLRRLWRDRVEQLSSSRPKYSFHTGRDTRRSLSCSA